MAVRESVGETHPRAAGWYLLTAGTVPRDAWLLGTDVQPLRLPLRPDGDGRLCRVVLLARPTTGLRVVAGDDERPVAFDLVPITRKDAMLRMVRTLASDGRFGRWRVVLLAGRMALRLLSADRRGGGDLLVAAYLGRGTTGAPCRLRAGRASRAAQFEPLEQLRAVREASGTASWETLGDDPKMRLASGGVPIALPAGWYLFRAVLRAHEGRIAGPAFYAEFADPATGAPDVEPIAMPSPGRDGRLDTLVMFKRPVRVLRFDPTSRQARFTFSGARLRRVGRPRALVRMLAARGADERIDWTASMRQLASFLRRARAGGLSDAAVEAFQSFRRQQADRSRTYAAWARRHDEIGPADAAMLRTRASRLADGPTFSILLPTYETPDRWLRECIDSVLAQAWPKWELCIADDASPSPRVRDTVARYAARDPRIRLVVRERNGHISAASNSALAMARGDYVALLDHDDVLRPHALLEMAEAIAANPDLDLLYSDEDKIDEHGRRLEPYFKPDWNPDLLLGQNYVCHLCVVRTALAREVGGFREGYEGSQDHDLVLRCTRGLPGARIGHVPRVLYHWRAIPGSTALHRDAKDYAAVAGARAVADHVVHEAPGATVDVLEHGHYRVRWPLPDPVPKVSIIVPTRDRADLLRACVESILGRTDYPDFELLVVDNRSSDDDALALLASLEGRDRVRVLRYDAPFNYSAINNWSVGQSLGSVVALVNNDIEVISPDWLSEMVAQAERAGVGAVGAMLLYPDDRIQHAGVILGLGGIANHAYAGQPADIGGHGGRAKVVQQLSAVTGACLVVGRDRYEAVGGLDEALHVAFNDIDFCLRLGAAGYRNLWTPFARLYHHESATRGSDLEGGKRDRFLDEVALMQARWGERLELDPAYNPNLALTGPGFEPADPPRA